MEVYSYNEKIQNQKIFDSKNLKETYSDFKNGENILSKINEKSSTPQNQHYFTQKDYEETKVIKENDPQTKETYISLKSKIVFGDNKETAKTKDSKDKKTEKNINEMKILPSLNESAHKPSDDDIINADLKKLSEKKNKTESKIKVPPIDKPKKIETKNETEVMRNPNQELPKKEKIFSENLSPKQNKLLDEPFESVQNIEKPQINSKKVMRVNLNEESIKTSDKKIKSQLNKRKKTGAFELKKKKKLPQKHDERFDIEKLRRIENEAAQSIQTYFRYYLKKNIHKACQTKEQFEKDINLSNMFQIMLQISALIEKNSQKNFHY